MQDDRTKPLWGVQIDGEWVLLPPRMRRATDYLTEAYAAERFAEEVGGVVRQASKAEAKRLA